MATRLIAITGKARSGKDTIAKHLWAHHGYTRIALADPIKLAVQDMFGLTAEQTWDADLKEIVIDYWGLSPREMFQQVGSNAMKPIFGDAVWFKRWLLSYGPLALTDDIVVPDVRFDDEATALLDYGAKIIEVIRGEKLVGHTAEHESEAGLTIRPHFIIRNDGTVEELIAKVEQIMGELA